MKIPTIAIIGGGFSGTLVLAHLVEQATQPLTIEWFEARPRMAFGVAYGTEEPIHLLNVRAGKISAFPDKPDDFCAWLAQHYPLRFSHDSFVPRIIYGEYLSSILHVTLAKAKEKNIIINQHHVVAEQVERQQQRLLINHTIVVDALVLATGNLPSSRWQEVAASKHYVGDVWRSDFRTRVGALPATSHLVIIGTGLTMIDTVLTLKKHGYQGKITAVSRGGHLPTVHTLDTPLPPPATMPTTALGILTFIRKQVRIAAQQGVNWRSVIDSLRPITPATWKQLSVAEKKKIIRRLLTFWSIHRHRMAPEIAAQIEELRQQGRLTIMSARITGLTPKDNGIDVQVTDKKSQIHRLHADVLLNCMGPELSVKGDVHPLLACLRDAGLITPSPTGLGVVSGPDSPIFPMGTLLVGELLECTAVPELREQVVECAKALTNFLNQVRQRN